MASLRGALTLALLVGVAQARPAGAGEPVQRVPFGELLAAMRAERGYDARKTTNLARFQMGVFLRLVESAQARRPQGPPLFFDHAEWFRAYLETTAMTAQQAPLSCRLSVESRQDAWVEYRRQRVVRRFGGGPAMRAALNVRVGPSPPARVPASYSYEDEESTPRLRVTVSREYRYRLVDLGDQVLFDDIEGLRGRPTSGVLGLLFAVIGEGHAVFSRVALADDGTQVVVGQAKKAFISRTATVTIRPDGRAEQGVLGGRSDLAALEARLRTPLAIEYEPRPETESGPSP